MHQFNLIHQVSIEFNCRIHSGPLVCMRAESSGGGMNKPTWLLDLGEANTRQYAMMFWGYPSSSNATNRKCWTVENRQPLVVLRLLIDPPLLTIKVLVVQPLLTLFVCTGSVHDPWLAGRNKYHNWVGWKPTDHVRQVCQWGTMRYADSDKWYSQGNRLTYRRWAQVILLITSSPATVLLACDSHVGSVGKAAAQEQ